MLLALVGMLNSISSFNRRCSRTVC